MKVFYAEANYGKEEINAVIEVLQSQRLSLMSGEKVRELEKQVSLLFRKNYGLMTNSGSSANLLAVKSLNLPEGSKVITPALTFSTTVAPIVQSNLVPYFVDVYKSTMQIDTSILSKVDLKNVSAICVPNLIGNIADWEKIASFAKENNLKVIEDSADTLGYTYNSSFKDWSDVSTTSFYASHVVTGAGFGGIVSFRDLETFNYAKSLRSWGRRSAKYEESEDFQRRFDCQIDGFDYDDKYVFDDIGYNFIPSEISAAFALIQMKNLNRNIQNRKDNFQYLENALKDYDNFMTFTNSNNSSSGWLAFPILLQNELSGKRKDFQIFLEKSGIQTRTIFTGNILRQPVAKKFNWDSFGDFINCDEIMQNGILLGCHNQMSKEKMDYMLEKIFEAENCLK